MMEGVGGDRPSWREWEETDHDEGGKADRQWLTETV